MDIDGLGPRRGAQHLNVLHGAVCGSVNGVAVEPRTNGFEPFLEFGLDLLRQVADPRSAESCPRGSPPRLRRESMCIPVRAESMFCAREKRVAAERKELARHAFRT